MNTGAQAVPGSTSTAQTTANVVVGSSITLSSLVPFFTLSGNPGESDSTTDPLVTMAVTTNNNQGYGVAVQSTVPVLSPATQGNLDTIPIGNLQVREIGDDGYVSLSNTAPAFVYVQDGPSAPTGDLVVNEYRVDIPFVTPDTYSAVLDYIAATL